MSRQRAAPPAARPWAWISLGLVLLPALATWPVAQGLVHGFVLVVLLPLVRDPLGAGLGALAAGWLAEATLRMVPHPGGVALADLSLILLLRLVDQIRPPDSRWIYVPRLVGALLLHAVLVHLSVLLANGPHTWGQVWLWPPLAAVFLGPLLWGFHQLHQKR